MILMTRVGARAGKVDAISQAAASAFSTAATAIATAISSAVATVKGGGDVTAAANSAATAVRCLRSLSCNLLGFNG